jgi:hypothetical protein
MDRLSKTAQGNCKLLLDSSERRAALLSACIDVMRDRRRLAPGVPVSSLRTGESLLASANASEISGLDGGAVQIRRVVTLVPAASTPEPATLS